MRISVFVPPSSSVVWQCIYQALQDYKETPKASSRYVFETPEGDVQVVIKAQGVHQYHKVTWRIYAESEVDDLRR